MLKLKQCVIVITLVVLSLGLVTVQTFAQEDFSKPDELVLKSEAVFKSFMADPQMEWFRKNVSKAKGVLGWFFS